MCAQQTKNNSITFDMHPEASYQAHIERVIRYIHQAIEQELTDELTLTKLATVANFSPFHFHRLFAAFIGVTLGEYIRAARLQRAALQLLDSPEKITEIALAAGYATPAAFTKAFKGYYAVTPS